MPHEPRPLDRPDVEGAATAREPSRPRPREGRRPCVYALPEDGPRAYVWWEVADSASVDGRPDSNKIRIGSGREWTGPGSFQASPTACRIVWGAEPLVSGPDGASSPWVDSATAAAIIVEEGRRARDPNSGRPIEVVVVGSDRVESHAFRILGEEGWLLGVTREDVQVVPIDPEDPASWGRLGFAGEPAAGDRLILASPALGEDRRVELSKRLGATPLIEPETLYRGFAKVWLRRGGIAWPITASDYWMGYRRARWGSIVPHQEMIRSASANFRRTYRLDGGDFDEHSVDFQVERRPSGGSATRRLTLPANRFDGLRDRIRSFEFEACPASGASRVVLRSEPRSASRVRVDPVVFWPIAGPIVEAPREAPPSPVAVSICLAVDARSSARAWSAVAPLVEGLCRVGRLARLQVVWSHPDWDRQRTRGWSPRQLEVPIGPPEPDSPDDLPCRGLSQALRESLWLDGEAEGAGRPAVGLVIVDRDYVPGLDRGFQDVGSRWAWFVRMRRILGAPVALLAYQSEGADVGLRSLLGHLVILGRQATTTRAPVATLADRQFQDPAALEAEIEAILLVADRMGALADPDREAESGPAPLCVVDDEDRPGPRPTRPIDDPGRIDPGVFADLNVSSKGGESS